MITFIERLIFGLIVFIALCVAVLLFLAAAQ